MTSIFNQNDDTSLTNEDSVDYVAQAKKKFSKEDGTLDVDALLNGKAESDKFIERLKKEQAQIRNDLNSRLSVEEALSKLVATPPNNSTSKNDTPVIDERLSNMNEEKKPIAKDDVLAMVREALAQESSKAKQASNIEVAKQELEKTFGSNYVQHLKQRADELGVTPDFLNRLAQESPKALVALVNDSKPKSNLSTPPETNMNPGSMNNSGGKNFGYYENLRKNDPRKYWSPALQNEMYANAAKLGPKFYD
jgi:hypothetical protein